MTIAPLEAVGLASPAMTDPALAGPAARPASGASFADLLMSGIEEVDSQLTQAEGAVRAFVVDDSIPVHQVTYALEHARLSFELMMQVRARLVEGYQELMRMQL